MIRKIFLFCGDLTMLLWFLPLLLGTMPYNFNSAMQMLRPQAHESTTIHMNEQSTAKASERNAFQNIAGENFASTHCT
jgi:hypothetical protein